MPRGIRGLSVQKRESLGHPPYDFNAAANIDGTCTAQVYGTR